MKCFLWLIPFVIVIIPLLRLGYFPMHDAQHVARLFVFDQALREGSLYPRWVEGLGFGFGYPLFNFYPPLLYYVAELFHSIGFGYVWSIKLMLMVGFALSFWGMYMLIQIVSKQKWASLLGGVLYLMAPYHAVLVYVRGAFAEFFAYAILPWVFVGFMRIFSERGISFFALTLALLVISHPFVAFPFVLLFSLFFFVLIFFVKKKAILIVQTALGGVIGLGLSAFFWLPSLFERRFTLVDKILTQGLADYKQHFLYIRQLFYSPWGYGGSIYGLLDGVSFRVGEVHILFSVIAAMTLLVWIIKRDKQQNIVLIGVFLVMGFISAFLTVFKSEFIWDKIPYLRYLQFPWRLLVFVSLFTSVGVGLWASALSKPIQKLILVLGFVLMLILYVPLFNPAYYIPGNDSRYIAKTQITWEVSKTSYEFMYKDVRTNDVGFVHLFPLQQKQLPSSLYRANPEIEVTIEKNTVSEKKFAIQADRNSYLIVHRSYFPGWNAYIDGTQTRLMHTDSVQRMFVPVPKGIHTVAFKFETTDIRVVSWVVTVFALLCWLYAVQVETMWASRFWIFLNKRNRPRVGK